MREPTRRFSSRVRDYVAARPGYPDSALEAIRGLPGVPPAARVADVGSGTGIFTVALLDRGFVVRAVEPNAEMRAVAEDRLAGRPGFESVGGRAEKTTLAPGSVDVVTCAQAFHWFDVAAARAEFRRILRPDGWVVIVWNRRRDSGTPFLVGYEELLRTHGTDYAAVMRTTLDPGRIEAMLGGPELRDLRFDHAQELDLAGLTSRLRSSSYTPPAGAPGHAAMLDAVRELFHAHERDGRVRLEYDTLVYAGRRPAAADGQS